MEDVQWFESWFDTAYYHILYKNRDDQEAKRFVENLISFLQLPQNSSVLDLACGKGRHSITLAAHGFNVLGVDLSEQSIAAAQQFEK
jgi:cyclopropane fatty-acyl-phospholipid synthase-like methyltransferase